MTGWTETPSALEKTFAFDSFSDAITWMFACSLEIDPLGHHPQWTNTYDRVSVKLTTHDAGDRVTDKDRELAELLDENYSLFTATKAHDENRSE